MARPQVQVSPRFPQLLPAAGAGQPGVGLQVSAPGSSLAGLGQLFGQSQRLFAVVAAEQEDQELTKYRAEAAANPALVEQLLDVAPGDQEGRARVFGAAVEAGLISQADSPFFRIAFREAEGRAAALRGIRNAASRIRKGEALPVEDPETGALTPGTPITDILDSELGVYRTLPLLRDSRLANAAFEGVVTRLAPGLAAQAQQGIDDRELARLQANVGDELSALTVRASTAQDGDLADIQAEVEKQADILRLARFGNYREITAEGLLRGVEIIASRPEAEGGGADRALHELNTSVGPLLVGGQALDDNPRTAELLAVTRNSLRLEADRQQARAGRDQEVTRQEQKREQESFIAKAKRDLERAGVAPTELRRRLLKQLENRIEQGSQAVELAPNAEHLRLDGLKFVDALLNDERAADPTVVQQLRQEATLATTVQELDALEQTARSLAGSSLVGPDLEAVMGLIQQNRRQLEEGFASSPIYSEARQRLLAFQAPDGLPADAAGELDSQRRALLSGFSTELRTGAAWANGEFDVAEVEKATARYEAKLSALTQGAAVKVEKAEADALTALLENASAAQIRREFSDRLDGPTVQRYALQAEARLREIDGTVQSERVQRTTADVRAVLAQQLEDAGVSPAKQALAMQDIDEELTARALERLRGQPVDPTNVERTLIAVGRELAKERLTELGGTETPSRAETYLPETEDGVATLQGFAQTTEWAADYERALEVAYGGGRGNVSAGSPIYAKLFQKAQGSPDPRAFDLPHSAAFAAGLLAARMPVSEARRMAGERVGAEIARGADPGRAFIAGMAPLGIGIDALLEGKASLNVFEAGAIPPNLAGPKADLEVSFKLKDVPPFTTAVFDSELAMERAFRTRGEDLDRLLKGWGLVTEKAQLDWGVAQRALAQRIESAKARNGE